MKVKINNIRLEQSYPSSDDRYRVVVDATVDGRHKQYTYREFADDAMEILTRLKDKMVLARIRRQEQVNAQKER